MKDLTNREIHWLIILAKDNEFFASLHDFYKRKGYLSRKQRYYLTRGIEKAEEDGDTILTTEEVAFLRDNADIDQDLKEILEIYEENGYLEEYEYNDFIHLKVKKSYKTDASKSSSKKKAVNISAKKSEDKILYERFKQIQEKGKFLREKNIPSSEKKAVNISTRKSEDEILYERFKQIQEKGKFLRERYEAEKIEKINTKKILKEIEEIEKKEEPEILNESTISENIIEKKIPKTIDTTPQTITPDEFEKKTFVSKRNIKKSEIGENERPIRIRLDHPIQRRDKSEVKSYLYRKEGNFITIYNKSNNELELKISIDGFRNEKGGLFKCDCGNSYFTVKNLVNHIVQKSKCLDHYISYPQKISEGAKIDSVSPTRVGVQKAKFLYKDNKYHKLDKCNFVIDGANIAREGGYGRNGGTMSNIHKIFDKFRNLHIDNYIIISDRSLNYTIDDRKEYSELVKTGKIIETPGGTEADHFILKYAKDNDAFIISNDLFKEFEPFYGKDWIRDKRISFKIINDKLYLDKIYFAS